MTIFQSFEDLFDKPTEKEAARRYKRRVASLLDMDFDEVDGFRFKIAELDGKVDQFLTIVNEFLDTIDHKDTRVGDHFNQMSDERASEFIGEDFGHIHHTLFAYVADRSNYLWLQGKKHYGLKIERKGEYRFSLLTYLYAAKEFKTAGRRLDKDDVE